MKKNNCPAFQFYAQDFLTGVVFLTNEEIGIYIKILAKQWTDGAIPKKRLGFLIGKTWNELGEELKNKFVDQGETIINRRLEDEREKRAAFKKKQSENGKKGGRPKKPKPKLNPNNNQSISQKKPLEDEDEIEDEIEPKNEIKLPFDSKKFRSLWDDWKEYKKDEFKFKYKSPKSEQAALTALNGLAKGSELTAIKIINKSLENGWKGFFELQNSKNDKSSTRIAPEPVRGRAFGSLKQK